MLPIETVGSERVSSFASCVSVFTNLLTHCKILFELHKEVGFNKYAKERAAQHKEWFEIAWL